MSPYTDWFEDLTPEITLADALGIVLDLARQNARADDLAQDSESVRQAMAISRVADHLASLNNSKPPGGERP